MLIITWRWGGRCHTHSEAPPAYRGGRLTVRRIYALCQQPKKLHSIFSREAQSKLQNISVTSWILDLLLQEHGHYTPPAAALQMQCLPEMDGNILGSKGLNWPPLTRGLSSKARLGERLDLRWFLAFIVSPSVSAHAETPPSSEGGKVFPELSSLTKSTAIR